METQSHSPGPCPICRESHGPRGLNFDGIGVNSCGIYRSRLATLEHDAPEHLGPIFAAAPDMLAALKGLFRECALMHKHGGVASNAREAKAAIAAARAAIAKARGES